jgi:hypothetical protein
MSNYLYRSREAETQSPIRARGTIINVVGRERSEFVPSRLGGPKYRLGWGPQCLEQFPIEYIWRDKDLRKGGLAKAVAEQAAAIGPRRALVLIHTAPNVYENSLRQLRASTI